MHTKLSCFELHKTRKLHGAYYAAAARFSRPTRCPAPTLLCFPGAILPLLIYVPASEQRRLALRTTVVLIIKASSAFVSAHSFTTDWDAARIPPPLLAFRVLLTGRVISHFSVGLGLQLPLVVDLPLQLAGVASAMATAIPRQCFSTVSGGAPAPGLLFQLNRGPFMFLQNLLDWPFFVFPTPPEDFILSDVGLCTAIYSWLQLALGVGVPAVVLWAAEQRERKRFLEDLLHTPQAPAAAALLAHQSGAQDEEDDLEGEEPSHWTYYACVMQIVWCLIRTACKLAL